MVNRVAGYLRESPLVVLSQCRSATAYGHMTQQQIKELQCVALADYHKGLITRTQLLNIVHTLDRKSFIKQ